MNVKNLFCIALTAILMMLGNLNASAPALMAAARFSRDPTGAIISNSFLLYILSIDYAMWFILFTSVIQTVPLVLPLLF